MSIKIMTKVWEDSSRSGTELLLMLAIADFANDDGEAYPGITRLSKKCRVSRSSVQRAIKNCEDSGELTVSRNSGIETGHGKTNLYRINVSKLRGVNLTPVAQVTPQGVAQVTPQGVAQVTPKPSVESSVESSVKIPSFVHLAEAIASICKINLDKLGHRSKTELSELLANFRDITPDQIHDFDNWRIKNHWTGKDPATLKQIGDLWGQYESWVDTGRQQPTDNSNGKQSEWEKNIVLTPDGKRKLVIR